MMHAILTSPSRAITVFLFSLQYATQAQIPLHDYWLSEVDSFRSFSKEVVSMGDEVMPAMSALRQSVDKVKQNMAQLEEVLLILLANKEEQTRQEWEAKKEKELADQKARFLSVHERSAILCVCWCSSRSDSPSLLCVCVLCLSQFHLQAD